MPRKGTAALGRMPNWSHHAALLIACPATNWRRARRGPSKLPADLSLECT